MWDRPTSLAGAFPDLEIEAMKQLRRFAPALVGGLATLPLASHAVYTAPTSFTSAITDATEAVGVLAGALIGVAAAAVVIMIALKYVKRIKGAG